MLKNIRYIFFAVILIIPFILIYLNKNAHDIQAKIKKAKMQDSFLDSHELKQIKRSLRLYNLNASNERNFECIKTVEIIVRTTLCIHNVKNDIYISGSIKAHRVWKIEMLVIFVKMVNFRKNIQAIDIGSNLGQYCLFAAKIGRKCVAVEPFNDNLIRIHKAAQIENIHQNIILVTNAISDTRGVINRLSRFRKNIGGQFLIKSHNKNSSNIEESLKDKYNVLTIKLNDLIAVLPQDFSEAILKIDIENQEFKAFKYADKLFERVKIHAVFMKWGIKNSFPKDEVLEFLEFLYSRNYEPIDTNLNYLERDDWKKWPYDLVWVHKDVDFLKEYL